jgi:hypothetical protein
MKFDQAAAETANLSPLPNPIVYQAMELLH